jgi:hypothetical protein
MSYGPVNPLETDPRYTTVDAVKKALGIVGTDDDADISQAIVGAEVQIDQMNERSFPDDPLTEPIHGDEIDGIPDSISLWALDASIAVYKLRDTTSGFQAGSDDWIGAIDTADQARRALTRNPLARGYKVAWGLA